eukprot:COSAG01_NODE_36139_length_521_cov_5.094787_1_plen_66_part_00
MVANGIYSGTGNNGFRTHFQVVLLNLYPNNVYSTNFLNEPSFSLPFSIGNSRANWLPTHHSTGFR